MAIYFYAATEHNRIPYQHSAAAAFRCCCCCRRAMPIILMPFFFFIAAPCCRFHLIATISTPCWFHYLFSDSSSLRAWLFPLLFDFCRLLIFTACITTCWCVNTPFILRVFMPIIFWYFHLHYLPLMPLSWYFVIFDISIAFIFLLSLAIRFNAANCSCRRRFFDVYCRDTFSYIIRHFIRHAFSLIPIRRLLTQPEPLHRHTYAIATLCRPSGLPLDTLGQRLLFSLQQQRVTIVTWYVTAHSHTIQQVTFIFYLIDFHLPMPSQMYSTACCTGSMVVCILYYTLRCHICCCFHHEVRHMPLACTPCLLMLLMRFRYIYDAIISHFIWFHLSFTIYLMLFTLWCFRQHYFLITFIILLSFHCLTLHWLIFIILFILLALIMPKYCLRLLFICHYFIVFIAMLFLYRFAFARISLILLLPLS